MGTFSVAVEIIAQLQLSRKMDFMSIFYMILCVSLFLFQTLEILLEYLKNPTSRRSALKVR